MRESREEFREGVRLAAGEGAFVCFGSGGRSLCNLLLLILLQLAVIRSTAPFTDMPVPAMLTGRGFRGVVTERRDTVEVIVDVDMALVGRDDPVPPGVTSPDRRPTRAKQRRVRKGWIDREEGMKRVRVICESSNRVPSVCVCRYGGPLGGCWANAEWIVSGGCGGVDRDRRGCRV